MLSFGAGSLKRKEENMRPVDFSVLSLLNCMVELGLPYKTYSQWVECYQPDKMLIVSQKYLTLKIK
jgi:hypothetical protein